MASEAAAVTHAAVRDALGRGRLPAWVDPAAMPDSAKRAGPLGAAIHRGWWANGAPEPRLVAEMGRISRSDALLVVELFRIGASRTKLAMRGRGTGVRPVAGTDGDWVSCGIRIALIRAPGGQSAWEGAALDSRPRTGDGDQEVSIRACVNEVMARFPRR